MIIFIGSEITTLYELGHYLADNLISKICMVVATGLALALLEMASLEKFLLK
jgi:hypothetical protein